MKVRDSFIYYFNVREKEDIVKVKKAYEKFKDLAIRSSLSNHSQIIVKLLG